MQVQPLVHSNSWLPRAHSRAQGRTGGGSVNGIKLIIQGCSPNLGQISWYASCGLVQKERKIKQLRYSWIRMLPFFIYFAKWTNGKQTDLTWIYSFKCRIEDWGFQQGNPSSNTMQGSLMFTKKQGLSKINLYLFVSLSLSLFVCGCVYICVSVSVSCKNACAHPLMCVSVCDCIPCTCVKVRDVSDKLLLLWLTNQLV